MCEHLFVVTTGGTQGTDSSSMRDLGCERKAWSRREIVVPPEPWAPPFAYTVGTPA